MTTNQKRRLTVGILSVPFFTLLVFILQCVSLFREYDASTGYYTAQAPVRTACLIVMSVAVLLFLIFALICRKPISTPVYTGSLSILFSSAFMAVCALAFTCITAFSIPSTEGITAVVAVLAAVAGLFSTCYFAWFLHPTSPLSLQRGMLGLSPAFLSVFAAMLLYFNTDEQINHPQKLLSLFAFAVCTFFALAECRGLLSRVSPAYLYLVNAIGVMAATAASLPNILYTLIQGKELVLSTVYDFLLFAYALYMLARLLQMLPYDLPVTHRIVQGFLLHEDKVPAEEPDAATEMEHADTEEEPTQIDLLESLSTFEQTDENATI